MIKPLTKRTKEDELYVHPPAVERNIESALGLGLEAIRDRLKEDEPGADGYLKSETLVHLFRRARDDGDDALCNLLATALLCRCEDILHSKQTKTSSRLHEDILAEFACLLVNDESEELDYYEVRFNHAFRTFRLGMVRTERRRDEKQESRTLAAVSTDSDDDEPPQGDEPSCRPTESDDLIRNELLDQLPEKIRHAVVLREMGYPIESNDPSIKSVASICEVNERTIHNWLKQAQEILLHQSKESE